LNRRRGGFQNWSGRVAEEIQSLRLSGFETNTLNMSIRERFSMHQSVLLKDKSLIIENSMT